MRTNKLYRLISVLSKSEKRHFTLFAQTFQKDSNNNDYLTLFQIIEKHEVQNDQELKKLISLKQFKNLPALKMYLYRKLLESLSLNSNRKIDNLYKELLNTRQLMKKSLFDDALTTLETLQNKPKELHVSLTEYDILMHQYIVGVLNLSGKRSRNDKAITILEQIQNHLDILSIQNQLLLLQNKVVLRTLNTNYSEENQKALSAILEDILMTDSTLLRSEACYHSYFGIKDTIYTYLGEMALQYENAQESFAYNLKLSYSIVTGPLLEAWQSLLKACINNNEKENFQKHIEYFDEKNIPQSLFSLYAFNKHFFLLKYCTKEKNKKFFLLKNVEEQIKKDIKTNKLSPYHTKYILMVLSRYLFTLNDIERSSAIIDNLILEHQLETDSNLQLSIALLFFLNQIESKNYKYCHNHLVSYQKRFKLKRPEAKSFNIVLNQLKRYCKYLQEDQLNKTRIVSTLNKTKRAILEETSTEFFNFYKDMYLMEWIEEQLLLYQKNKLTTSKVDY